MPAQPALGSPRARLSPVSSSAETMGVGVTHSHGGESALNGVLLYRATKATFLRTLLLFSCCFIEEKHARDEAVTENKCKEYNDDQLQGESEGFVKSERPVAGKSSKQNSTSFRKTHGNGNRERKKPTNSKSNANSNSHFKDYNRFSS